MSFGFDIPNLGYMRTWVDANGWTIIDHRDSMEWIPPEGWFEWNRPSPEEERKIGLAIAEWMRTHPPVAIFCRLASSDENNLVLIPISGRTYFIPAKGMSERKPIPEKHRRRPE